jgi:CDP-glycerol glycerophosphotransferase (TagB/SpsB family)
MIDKLMAEYPESDRLEWNRDNDNFEVLRRSDILISDFSGVIFDFSLVYDKPVIYADTAFDKAPYDAYWLEDELWTFATLPAIGQQLTEDNLGRIGDVIDTCLHDPRYQAGRDRARQETWAHIGTAAERTVDYLMQKYEQLHPEAEQEQTREDREPVTV